MTSYSPNEDESHPDALSASTSRKASVFLAATADERDLEPPAPRLPHPHIGWALVWMLVFGAVQIAVSIAVAGITIAVAVSQGHVEEEQIEQAIASASVTMIPIGTLFSVITAIAIALIFYRRQFSVRLALRGMTVQHWLASLLAVLPLAVIASEITNCAGEVLPSLNAEVLGQFAASPWPLVFVAACLFPAIGEEIFCRGFLGRGLVAHHGAVGGVLLASLLFGIMHIDPVQSVGAFALGLGLHFIYLTTRSLLAPMLVHMLNNAFAFWVMRNYEWCPLPGLSLLPDGSQVHTPPSVMIAAIVTATGLFYWLYQSRTNWRLMTGDPQDESAKIWSPGYVTAEQPPSDVECQLTSLRSPPWIVAAIFISYVALLGVLAIESRAILAP